MKGWNLFAAVLLLGILIMPACKPSVETPAPPSVANTPAAAALVETLPATLPTVSPPIGPSSAELIAAALADGKIDENTALKYQVFAQFQDARLPLELAGSPDPGPDSHILDTLQAAFFSLPAADQTALLPFLVPPVYTGSWGDPAFSPAAPSDDSTDEPKYKPDAKDKLANDLPCSHIDQENWETLTGMHAPVRFWWLKSRPQDEAIVHRYQTAMDDDVWPKLTNLMGRTPKLDEGYACNGGSGDFDVYVTPEVARSYAAALFPPGCNDTPSYIVINPQESDAILAHEFMHAIQWAYQTSADCMYPGNYAWLAEATASWSQNFVYPKDNAEHDYVPWFYEPTGVEGGAPNLDQRNDSHEYGAHLYFFYLTNSLDQPEIVRNAWDNTESMPSLEAVDQAVPGGFDGTWGEFAVHNVDEPPFDDYQVWDAMNIKPSGASLKKVKVSNAVYPLPSEIGHLSIEYNWYTFTEVARLVSFYNGTTYQLDLEPINTMIGMTKINDGTTQFKFTRRTDDAVSTVKVQALYRVEGEVDWVLEDWTDRPYSVFCRDARAERLTDLVIITSNSATEGSVTATGATESRLSAADMGCWRYGGDASLTFEGQGDGGSFTDKQQMTSVAFERTETHATYTYPSLRFTTLEGQWERSYHYASSNGDCVGDGQKSGVLGSRGQFSFGNEIYVLYGAVAGPSVDRYAGIGTLTEPVIVNFVCPETVPPSPIQPMSWLYIDVLSEALEKVYSVGKGGTLEGSDNMLKDVDSSSMLYTWHFVPLREP